MSAGASYGRVSWVRGDRLTRRLPIDRHLRGRVAPRILEALERRGWRIHRIGAAAYVHAGDRHYLVAVVERRRPPAPWIGRLVEHHRWVIGRGPAPALERRRLEALELAWSGSRIRDRHGRYLGRPAWWQADDGRPLHGWVAPSPRSRPVTARRPSNRDRP